MNSKILRYTVPPEDDGRLVWRIARGKMGVSARQLSRAKVINGLILDGESVHADRAVRAGQTLCIEIYDDAPAFAPAPEEAEVDIVYEDEDIYVVNKPAPLAVQSSPRQSDNTLENRLAFRFKDIPGFIFRPVNRLDKGTSGLMAAAKHAHAQAALAKQLHTPAFVREYLAVVQGAPEPAGGVIDLPIGKADGATVKREVRPDGKPCRTHYDVVSSCGGISLVHLVLETGRTHQIRVHMKAIGCPVLGDFLYGEERPDVLPGRFALHSARMRFLHPLSGKELAFSSPLPPELQSLMCGGKTE